MSVYTTLTISRKAALAKMMELQGKSLTNRELEEILDAFFESHCYNFSVVCSHEAEDDKALENLTPRNY